jgi:hypothetical protein
MKKGTIKRIEEDKRETSKNETADRLGARKATV